jgi:hypothetical protein
MPARSATHTPQTTTEANPLDALLQRLADRATSPRVRRWAGALLEGGESATSGTLSPPKGRALRHQTDSAQVSKAVKT